MWLSLLLSAIGDTLGQRERRASLHELHQRLFPFEPARGPSLSETLVEFARRLSATDAQWSILLEHTVELLAEIDRTRLQAMKEVQWFQIPVLANRSGDGRFLYLPPEDIEEFKVAFREHRPPRPQVRTERDALIRLVLWAWANDKAWDAKALANQGYSTPLHREMSNHLSSVNDWFTALHPDLTHMDWPEVLAASQAWHQRFVRAGFGDPCAPTLVVLRWPDGWTLQRLTEKKDFAAEGTSMGHCIGGPDRGNGVRDGESIYWQRSRDNRALVFSLRDSDGHPLATIEAAPMGGVRQVQGPRDQEPSGHAMTKLREACWALNIYPAQPQVHRLGAGLVTAAEIRADPQFRQAQAQLNSMEAELRTQGVHSGSPPVRLYSGAVWTRVADLAHRLTKQNSGRVQADEPTEEIRPHALPAPVRSLGGVYLGDAGTRLLMGFVQGERIRLATGLAHGPDRLVLHRSLFSAFKGLTGLPNDPPDVSHIEVLPGLPPGLLTSYRSIGHTPPTAWETMNNRGLGSVWQRVFTPIGQAREQRAAQSVALG